MIKSDSECQAAFPADSNTAGGFHLLFDIFCLVIIVYSEMHCLIIPDTRVLMQKQEKTWHVPLASDLSLNSRWKKRLELLPIAIQSIASKDELLRTEKHPKSKDSSDLSTQLAEWFLHLLHEMNSRKLNFPKERECTANIDGCSALHIRTIHDCLSAFKGAEKYEEASMWARLLSTHCM